MSFRKSVKPVDIVNEVEEPAQETSKKSKLSSNYRDTKLRDMRTKEMKETKEAKNKKDVKGKEYSLPSSLYKPKDLQKSKPVDSNDEDRKFGVEKIRSGFAMKSVLDNTNMDMF